MHLLARDYQHSAKVIARACTAAVRAWSAWQAHCQNAMSAWNMHEFVQSPKLIQARLPQQQGTLIQSAMSIESHLLTILLRDVADLFQEVTARVLHHANVDFNDRSCTGLGRNWLSVFLARPLLKLANK